ncbi:P-loop NTPase fold protein, partial [Vibrio alginolyticus]|uniref:P-loop NTPase fold protein n=1 Tax=Vibrio alginolyticus TaxID=663 RepID=UPI003D7C8E3C
MSIQNITFNTRDEYNRIQTADGIKKLLSNETLNISRLLINGEWGEGKTEFCHKLLNHFGNDYHLVYVDAFASDSVDNPLLTLTAEIAKLIPQGKT